MAKGLRGVEIKEKERNVLAPLKSVSLESSFYGNFIVRMSLITFSFHPIVNKGR